LVGAIECRLDESICNLSVIDHATGTYGKDERGGLRMKIDFETWRQFMIDSKITRIERDPKIS